MPADVTYGQAIDETAVGPSSGNSVSGEANRASRHLGRGPG
ncbi:hypothetical protein HMPREF1034_1867 [Cutibacterium acnes SK187]|nr:hypothetical protein HMPREF1034_1867 [Cutibacterium acnes SK187]